VAIIVPLCKEASALTMKPPLPPFAATSEVMESSKYVPSRGGDVSSWHLVI